MLSGDENGGGYQLPPGAHSDAAKPANGGNRDLHEAGVALGIPDQGDLLALLERIHELEGALMQLRHRVSRRLAGIG